MLGEKRTSNTTRELLEKFKGGVIMDVTTPEQAKIAEEAGACAVIGPGARSCRYPGIRGSARMADPDIISGIMDTVTIPVMAKVRIGHFVEAQILESLGVDLLMRVKFSLLQMRSITSINTVFRCLLSVVPGISVRPCAGSEKGGHRFGRKVRQGLEIL